MNQFLDIIEYITENIDPKSEVIITTYQFNPDFFEKHIFSHFRPPSYPLILIDSNVYQENKKEFLKSKNAGRRYFVESISCRNTFHPKLFFSISEKKVFILVGSNNLTTEGYTTNAEVVTPISIDLENQDNFFLLDDVKFFLQGLYDIITSDLNKQHLLRIIELMPKTDINQERNAWILNNVGKKSLLEQILDIISEPINKIHVVSPFFSQNSDLFSKIIRRCNNLSIYIQQDKSNLPKEALSALNGIQFFSMKIENERYLHGKLLFFETDEVNYVFTGSANFSESALTTDNNIELGILIKTDLHFEKIVSPIGTWEEITLENIGAQSIQSNYGENILPLQIYEARLQENTIIITFKDLNNPLKYLLVINEREYEFPYTIHENSIIFEIDDDLLSTFKQSAAIEIIGRGEGLEYSSNFRILSNKTIFPDEFNALNYANFDDANWLFKILQKIINLPNPEAYYPILEDIVKRDILEGKEKQNKIFELDFKNEGYNPSLKMNGLIDIFIKRHQNKIDKSIKLFNKNDLPIVMNSFILTNRLILWSIARDIKKISELRLIKNNLLNLLVSDPNYLDKLDDFDIKKCLTDYNLKAHTAITVFLIDFLQNQSPEYKPDPRLGFNSVKRTFEEKTTKALGKLIDISDNQFSEIEFSDTMIHYAEIIPGMSQISVRSFEARINDIFHRVGLNYSIKIKSIP